MAKELYLLGRYWDAAEAETLKKSVCYKIGALVFVGRHQEARLLFKDYAKSLDLSSLVIAQFHLGVSFTRTSDYEQASQCFCKNLKLLRSVKLDNIASFYAYQGVSFYRFFFSKNRRSQKYAEKGYACLLREKSSYPLLTCLSLDIQGHNLIQVGKIQLGLESLRKALAITKKNNLDNLQSEIAISLKIYESEYDDCIERQIEELEELLAKTDNKNDHSRSELILQIAKLYIIKGEYARSHQFLTNSIDVFYKNENKRKIAKLNTLLAQLLYCRGQFMEALTVAKIAKTNLNERTDLSLILPILGIELKALQQMGKTDMALVEQARQLVTEIDRYLNQRIQSRADGVVFEKNRGEDKLGDLMDLAQQQEARAIDAILATKAYSLVSIFYSIAPGKRAIIISRAKSVIFILTEQKVQVQETRLTKIQLEVLKHLRQPITKEQLVEKVWGYEYDPLRHDSLVYAAIARLRRVLLDQKAWIVADGNHYYMTSEVEIVFENATTGVPRIPAIESSLEEEFSLNYRQIETINQANKKMFSVSEYGKLWGVTRMTALRDLNILCKEGMVEKTGRGKSTRYFINRARPSL